MKMWPVAIVVSHISCMVLVAASEDSSENFVWESVDSTTCLMPSPCHIKSVYFDGDERTGGESGSDKNGAPPPFPPCFHQMVSQCLELESITAINFKTFQYGLPTLHALDLAQFTHLPKLKMLKLCNNGLLHVLNQDQLSPDVQVDLSQNELSWSVDPPSSFFPSHRETPEYTVEYTVTNDWELYIIIKVFVAIIAFTVLSVLSRCACKRYKKSDNGQTVT